MKKSNKHENYEVLNLLGYGLSKFNNSFIEEFGFQTKSAFYEGMVHLGLVETGSVVKNRQDLFDPFFDNGRKGWWQKGDTYKHRKTFIDSLFGDLDVFSYADVVKMYLQEKFNYQLEKAFTVKPIIRSQFKKLQETGIEAELFFMNNYKSLILFEEGKLQDARLLGDGYDFQIDIGNAYFLAEVKGVRETKGTIRLTKNEYNMANEYQDRYILTIISNLNDTPKITLVSNPLHKLEFSKNILRQEQTQYNTKSIIW